MSGSTTKVIILLLIAVAAVSIVAFGWVSGKLEPIPYNNSSPVIYDNDETIDVYTDDYLMALSDLGDIRLLGFVTSSSVEPFNKWVSDADFDRMIKERDDGLRAAKDSGLHNIPKHYVGTRGHLVKPQSGLIEDTTPLDSDGSRFIIKAAKQCSPEKPLVLIMGPLTVAADAYLLDNSIKGNVVVAWLGGKLKNMGAYNGTADPWAAYIVLNRFRLVQFSEEKISRRSYAPTVSKRQLSALPPSELQKWMIAKQHPIGLPDERDADAPPAIFLMRPDYVVRSGRLRFAMRLGLKKNSKITDSTRIFQSLDSARKK